MAFGHPNPRAADRHFALETYPSKFALCCKDADRASEPERICVFLELWEPFVLRVVFDGLFLEPMADGADCRLEAPAQEKSERPVCSS